MKGELEVIYSGDKKPFNKDLTYTVLRSFKDIEGEDVYIRYRINNVKQRRNNKKGIIVLKANLIDREYYKLSDILRK